MKFQSLGLLFVYKIVKHYLYRTKIQINVLYMVFIVCSNLPNVRRRKLIK